MSELNFKPDATRGYTGDKAVPVPALDAGVTHASNPRQGALGRMQRRRLNATRLQLEDTGFRLFRIY
jgi:hypothetical protein